MTNTGKLDLLLNKTRPIDERIVSLSDNTIFAMESMKSYAERLEHANFYLELFVDEMNRLHPQSDSFQGMIASFREELIAFKTDYAPLEQEFVDYACNFNDFKLWSDSLTDMPDELEEKLDNLESRFQNLKETLETLNAKLSFLRTRINNFGKKLGPLAKNDTFSTISNNPASDYTILSNQMSAISDKLEKVIDKTNQIDDMAKTLSEVVAKTNQIDDMAKTLSEVVAKTNQIDDIIEKVNKIDNIESEVSNISKKLTNVGGKADRNYKMITKLKDTTTVEFIELKDTLDHLTQDKEAIIPLLQSKKILPMPLP